MEPHIKIVPADAQACRHSVRRFFIKIEALDQEGILRIHRRQQSLHAGTNNALFLFIRRRIELMFEFCQGSVARITTPIQIDNRAPEDPVELGSRIVLITNLIGSLQRFEQAFLNRIGGKFRIAKALASKPNEFMNVIQ